MLILPAIDLLDGACVRLRRGDYERVTEFSRDPVAVARRFVSEGARWLHVVDLDGARDGRPVNREAILAVARAAGGVPVQLGGGIRDAATAAGYLDAGVGRVVMGTAAAEWPLELASAVAAHGPERVAAAVDLEAGRPRVGGWRRAAAIGLDALLERLATAGVTTLLYTDVRRDGTLSGPDVEGTRRLATAGWRVLAAGGVRRAAHLRRLREAGAAGAVVGSALYHGTLTLAEARAAGEDGEAPPAADPPAAGAADRASRGEEEAC